MRVVQWGVSGGVVQWGVSGGAHGSGPMGSKWRGTWEWSNGE